MYTPGERINNEYLVTRVIHGGMGTVCLCTELADLSPIALKTVRSEYLASREMRSLLEQEVLTWFNLGQHPNIVRCFGFTYLDNQPFIKMEWVRSLEGDEPELRHRVARGPLILSQSIEICVDICRGLIHAQAQSPGFVHRDLKPDNILVSGISTAKISDFGIAKVTSSLHFEQAILADSISDDLRASIHSGMLIGTPQYMAPEQWRCEKVDQRVDIYAIGCMLFEMLSGGTLYSTASLDVLRDLHCQGMIPKITDIRFDSVVPETKEGQRSLWSRLLGREVKKERLLDNIETLARLNTILSRCLSKDKGDRFSNVHELLSALIDLYYLRFGRTLPPATSAESSQVMFYLESANIYLHLGKIDRAMKDIGMAIRLSPNESDVYVLRALARERLGQFQQAIEDYDHAIILAPNSATAYSNRGFIHYLLGQYEQSLADYALSAALDPNRPSVYNNRGITYKAMKQYDRAIIELNIALRLNPRYPKALLNRGVTFADIDRPLDAISDYNQAIELDPFYDKAYMNRGVAFANMDRPLDAISDYDQAIELDPLYDKAYMNRGLTLMDMERLDEAFADFSQAIEINPNYAKAYYNRGLINIVWGRGNDALADIQRAIKAGTTDPEVFSAQASLLMELGDLKSAIREYTALISRFPSHFMLHFQRGLAYRKFGKNSAAIADYLKTIEMVPDFAEAYYNLSIVYERTGELTKMVNCLSRCIALQPDHKLAYVNRGLAFVRKQETEKAFADFSQAILADPNFAKAYVCRGLLHFGYGEIIKASNDFIKALENEPNNIDALFNLGTLHLEHGNKGTGIDLLSKAVTLGDKQAQSVLDSL